MTPDLEKMMEGAKLGALFLNGDLSIRGYTATLGKWFRITPKDCGQPVSRLERRLSYDTIEEDANQVFLSHKPVEREMQTKTGKSFLVRISPNFIHRTKSDGVIITFIDITARKESEAMLRNMVDAAPDATLVVDEEGNIILVSKQLENLFGYNRQQLVGRPVWTLIPERFHQIHPHHRRRYFYDPRVRPMGSAPKLFARRSDGSEFPVEISLSPLQTPDGTLAIAAIRDITERVETEQKMRQLNALLADAEQKERQRISQMLHDELQQRLFAIKAQFSTLSNARLARDWEMLQAALSPMEEWLTDTISITRNLSVDLYPIIPQDESLVDALTRLSAQMEKQYSLNVTLKADAIKISFGESLKLLLFQVVRELLFNVVKHGETLQASLSLERMDHEVRITVSDEGKGFDPVAVLGASGGAHGLLAIRNRLDLMGCQMEVVSQTGMGTQIVIHCPNPN